MAKCNQFTPVPFKGLNDLNILLLCLHFYTICCVIMTDRGSFLRSSMFTYLSVISVSMLRLSALSALGALPSYCDPVQRMPSLADNIYTL